jgi:SAM-dependent methyltransferase
VTDTSQTATAPLWSIEDISDGGERITHLHPNDCYFAHLSIYHLAVQFIQDKLVIDAGSGAGYGSMYLAQHGARQVYGLEVSPQAVAFSQHHFQHPNLHYQVMDLQQITGFEPNSIDVIFSSNVLEHIPNVPQFLRRAWEVLKTDGLMVIAVPPIISEDLQADNLANPYHLNIWTPRQWHHALSHYFTDIQYYRHGFDKPGVSLDFSNAPEQTVVDETDFLFESLPIEQAFDTPTLTAIFVAQAPRAAAEVLDDDGQISFVDDSFTIPASDRIAQTMSAHLARKMRVIQELEAQIAEQQPGTHNPCVQSRVKELEAALAAKNAHIASLEDLIRRIESGRIMRGLQLLHRLRSYYQRRRR